MGGLVTAVVVAAFVEMLARRRAYAVALADERTGELRTTLTTLDDLRRVIERLLAAGETAVVRTEVPGNKVTYVSPNIERLFGISQAAASDVLELNRRVHPDDRAMVAAAQDEVTAHPQTLQRLDARLRHGDGTHRRVSLLLVADRDHDGKVLGTLWYVADIDEERRTEEALREREATLSAVFSASPDVITSLDAGRGHPPRAARPR